VTEAECGESSDCLGILVVPCGKPNRVFERQSKRMNRSGWRFVELRESPPGKWKVTGKAHGLESKSVSSFGIQPEEE
jgi:hypothetical protein